MSVVPSIVEAIGNTPLIKLTTASEATGCTILGKAEFLNPGQSVKDRAALFLSRDAIARGLVKPGGPSAKGTAPNTGIGLATCARATGIGVAPELWPIVPSTWLRATRAPTVSPGAMRARCA